MSRHPLVALFFFAVVLGLRAPQLRAQTVTGSLSGHVTDSSGALVPNVRITVRHVDTGALRETVSGSEGYYFIPYLPLGTYEVTAELQGFATVVHKNIGVTLNKTTSLDILLTPSTVQETVTVSESAPLIDTTSGQIRRTLDDSFIDVLPSAGRNFLGLAPLLPGFQTNPTSGQNNYTLSSGSSVSFNGTGTRGTTFLTDGVTNDDGSENQNRQGVNISTIKEMQVITNNFAPEFGRGFGAVVLVETKSGTNTTHGDAYWYLRNSALDARGFFDPRNIKKPVSQSHRAGGTFGGHIIRDRLFYFGSLERFWQPGSQLLTTDLLPAELRTPMVDPSLPDAGARTAWVQSIIDRFPADLTPNNPSLSQYAYTGSVPRSSHTKDYTGRVDWRVSSKDLLYVRYQFSTYHFGLTKELVKGENVVSDHRFQSVGLTETHVFTPMITGEFRFGFGRRRITVNFLSGEATPPIVRWSITGFGSSIIGNASSYPQQRYQNDFQYVYNISAQLGSRNTLQAGTDIRRIQLNDRAENYNRGLWTFGSASGFNALENFVRGFVQTFQKGYGPAYVGLRSTELNFYGQDDLRVSRSLTINFGFRAEHVGALSEVNNLVAPDYPPDGYLEPRLGFAYSPGFSRGFLRKVTGGPGRTAVRGGFGTFHGRIYQSIFSQIGASTRFNPPNAVLSFSDPFLSVADPTGGFVFRPGPPTAQVGLTLPDANLHMPYTEQWNLTMERQLPWKAALQASYIGNRGIGLLFYRWDNRAQFPWTSTQPSSYGGPMQGNFPGVTFDKIDPDLFDSAPAPGFISLSQSRLSARRTDGRYGSILRPSNGSWSYYHALQITYTQRPIRGLYWQAGYIWSKNIDTGSEATFVGGGDINAAVSETQGTRSLRGLSRLSQPQRFTLSYVYELPFYRRQKAIFGHVLGGWELSGITTFGSGNPFTVFIGYDLNGDGIGGDRPFVRDPSILGRSVDNGRVDPATGKKFSTEQLPISAFYPDASVDATKQWPWFPGTGLVANLGRNTFFAHGQNNWDLAIIKNTKVYGERHTIQFRAEMFNLMNRVQFDFPSFLGVVDTGVARWRLQPRFGEITGQRNSPRFMQLSLRYAF